MGADRRHRPADHQHLLSDPATSFRLTFARNGAQSRGTTDTQSAYVFDTIKIGDKWILNGGVRLDHYTTEFDAVALQGTVTPPAVQPLPPGTRIPTSLKKSDNLLNGKLSALYKLTPESSVYALVASSKSPPGGTNFTLSTAANSAANVNYDPQETTTTSWAASGICSSRNCRCRPRCTAPTSRTKSRSIRPTPPSTTRTARSGSRASSWA